MESCSLSVNMQTNCMKYSLSGFTTEQRISHVKQEEVNSVKNRISTLYMSTLYIHAWTL